MPVIVPPEVMTLSQFRARRGYDSDPSHDRFRFPNGISKRQAKSNKAAASHHLREGVRAMKDYSAAILRGEVRPPTEMEEMAERFKGHPANESVRATWRLKLRRRIRISPGKAQREIVEEMISDTFGARDYWSGEFGLGETASLADAADARLLWMHAQPT